MRKPCGARARVDGSAFITVISLWFEDGYTAIKTAAAMAAPDRPPNRACDDKRREMRPSCGVVEVAVRFPRYRAALSSASMRAEIRSQRSHGSFADRAEEYAVELSDCREFRKEAAAEFLLMSSRARSFSRSVVSPS